MGEVSTAVFALGLHQEPDSTVPFFLKETRKRIMLAAYALDKQLATFLGRPPLISWRYCDIDPPLDLSYDEIVANPETRNAAIASLEENNGWNKEGIASKGGFARAILITSITREKVLELSLCRRADDLAQKVEYVVCYMTVRSHADSNRNMTQEAQQMRLELPQFLHWVPDNERSAQPHDDNMLFSLHIDFLYSEFLLYRILDRRTQGQSDGLINTSQEILNALRQMVGKKNRSRRAVLDIGWIVSIFIHRLIQPTLTNV